MKRLVLGFIVCCGLMGQSQPQVLQNGWLSGDTTPGKCSTGNSPDFYNTGSKTLFHCIDGFYQVKNIVSSIVDSPDTLTATLVNSAGNIDNGVHLYRVTFITSNGIPPRQLNGETYAVTNIITITDKTVVGQVRLTLPISSDSRVIGRRLYRTKAGGTDYYSLTTVTDNTTTSYVDNVADNTLTVTAKQVSPYFNDWNSTGTALLNLGDGSNGVTAIVGDGSLLIQRLTLNVSNSIPTKGFYTVYTYNTGDSVPLPSVVDHVTDLYSCFSDYEGLRTGVRDALTPVSLAPVVGGGSVHVGVYCDGTNWIVQ